MGLRIPATIAPGFLCHQRGGSGDFGNAGEMRPDKQNRVLFQEIRPFESFEAAGYTVTPLPANHDPASGPEFFLIEDGEKSLLYANDTGWFPEETWEWLEKHGPHLDFVSLDCTGGLRTGWRNGHMGLDTAMEALTRLRHMGLRTTPPPPACTTFHTTEAPPMTSWCRSLPSRACWWPTTA